MADLRGYIRERGSKLEAVIIRPDGSKVTRSTGCTLDQRGEAQAILDAALEQLAKDQPRAAASGPLTVREWGERWIEDRRERGKMEWVYERGHLNSYLFPPLGDRPLTEITDVAMLDWARGLERIRGPSGKTPGPKYVRRLTATVRALFKEAVKRHFIERTPCIWDNTDLPELEANSRVVGEGFEVADVAVLTSDLRIPEERRVLYALEFLTGMRTGEAAARCWKDWEPDFLGQLGRLTAATAWSTRHHLMKTTKTRVEKWIPVHPRLAELLAAWHQEGFERYVGRPPAPDDLIVPATKGGARNNSYSWRMFQTDLERVGLTAARHYDTRSAFISMAEGAGADPIQVARITHASLNGAKDLYRRVRLYWPLMCEAVKCIRLPDADSSDPGVAEGVAVNRGKVAGASESAKNYATLGKSRHNGRARESNPPAAPLSTTHRF